MKAFGRILNALEDVIASLFLLSGLGLVFVNVIGRYIFSKPIFWADEVAAYLIIWAALFGLGIAFKDKRHIQVTMLYAKMPLLVKRILTFIVNIGGILFCVLFVIGGMRLEQTYLRIGQESLNAQIPLWIPNAIIPIAGVIFCIRFVIDLIALFKSDWAERQQEQEEEAHGL
jgi:C4-dicarboxylate transporter DctQ subunit